MKFGLKLLKKWAVAIPAIGLIISIVTSGAVMAHINGSQPPTV